MIRVRRHTRELPSGKTANVRQHERSGGESRGRDTADDWWDRREDPQDVSGDHPEGTTFFRQDDQIMAVHPDGTVHPLNDDEDGGGGDDGGGWSPEDEPEGTWYMRQGDDIYAVRPDGSTHPLPREGEAPSRRASEEDCWDEGPTGPVDGWDEGPTGPVEGPVDVSLSRSPAQRSGWQYCNCEGSHRPRCPNDRPGGLPPLNDSPDDDDFDAAPGRDAYTGTPEDDDGYAAYQARTDELDRRIAAGESITEILQQEHVARMRQRIRDIYGIEPDDTTERTTP